MSIKNHTDLNSEITSDITNNGSQLITGLVLQSKLLDLADSAVNKLGDIGIAGVLRYSSIFSPSNDGDIPHKKYVDDLVGSIDLSSYFKKDGSVTASGSFNLGGNAINNASSLNTSSVTGSAIISDHAVQAYTNSNNSLIAMVSNDPTSYLRYLELSTGRSVYINFPIGLASTYNLSLPAASGTIALTSTTLSGYGITDGLSTSLSSGKINVGNVSNIATAVSLTLSGSGGSFALSNTGVLTLPNADTATRGLLLAADWNTFNGKLSANQTITLSGDISGSGSTAITTAIGAGKVTSAMLAGSITASKLVGTDIATVGTIIAGTWNGSLITGTYGGTGVNNGSNTITLGGNLTTTGAFNATFAVPRSTTWTLPNTASETLAGLGTAQSFTAAQTISNATASTTSSTGALIVTGGGGFGGSLNANAGVDSTHQLGRLAVYSSVAANLLIAHTDKVGDSSNYTLKTNGLTTTLNAGAGNAVNFALGNTTAASITATTATLSTVILVANGGTSASSGSADFTTSSIGGTFAVGGTFAGSLTGFRVSPFFSGVTGSTANLIVDFGKNSAGGGAKATHTSYFTINNSGDIALKGGKLGLYSVSPVSQPTTGITGSSFTANSGTGINDASTFDGYTIKQMVAALRQIGALA